MGVATAEAPTTIFNKITGLRVPDDSLIDEQYASPNPNAEFGPYTASDANTSIIATRQSVCIPAKYASICLREPQLTFREAWDQVRGAIKANGEEALLSGVIDWFRAILSIHSSVGNEALDTPALSLIHI